MTERQVSEAEVDHAVSRAFGRPSASVEVVGLFREAGLCEESAQAAARGLDDGVYFSFEDAALSQSGVFHGESRSRNVQATPARIAEVAQRLPEHLKVQE